MEQEIENLLKQPVKWHRSGEVFHVQMDAAVTNALPPGAYTPEIGMTGPYVKIMDLKQEELIPFKQGPCQEVIDEVGKFWNLKNRYEKLGLPYRRGILMYGPPGTGKTGIVRLVAQNLIKNDGIVMIVNDPELFITFIPLLNKLEPNRNMVIVLEDIEKLIDRREQEFLQLLDGIGNDRPGMLFLATTNYLNVIEPRVYRPSRFDLLIEVGMPTKKTREIYVRRLCDKFKTPFNKRLVELSDGLSFAHLKEMLISHLVLDKDVKQIAARMRAYAKVADNYDD